MIDKRTTSRTAGIRLTPRGMAVSLVLLTVIFAAISYAAIFWTSFGGATAIWPTNALALVAILRGPKGWVWSNFWISDMISSVSAGLVCVM